MRVFLSYASADRELAEPIAHSIRARGHAVFFDRADLPAGETYEDQIQTAVARAGLLVFLVSPASVAPGRFTRTELGFAQAKWPSAANRVLPVMLRPTPLDAVPAYLRSVTILEPEGNVAAEVAVAVDRIAKRFWRLGQRLAALMLGAALVVGIGYAALHWQPQAAFTVAAEGPDPLERGFFGEPDRYAIGVTAANDGNVAGRILETSLEVEPAAALVWRPAEPEAAEGFLVAPGSAYRSTIIVDGGAADVRWRACVHPEDQAKRCTAFADWQPSGAAPYLDSIPLDAALARTAWAVAWDGAAFLVAAADPDRILRLAADGSVAAEAALAGMPMDISAGPHGIVVAVAAPNLLIQLDPADLTERRRLELHFPEDLEAAWGEPVSDRPVEVAQTGDHVWVRTQDGDFGAGLGYVDPGLQALNVPPFFEEIAFDLPGLRLRGAADAVWAGDRDTTPASIYRLTASALTVLGGHDFAIASCASDVLPLGPDALAVPDCDGLVHEVRVTDRRLAIGRPIGPILGYDGGPDSWDVVSLARTADDRLVGAVSTRVTGPMVHPERHGATLSALEGDKETRLKLAVEGASILDLAVGPDAALVILLSDDGTRQLVAPSLTAR